MLTEADITKYQKIYKTRFGKDIDRHTARHELSLLVRQIEIIYQPISVQDLEDVIIKDAQDGILNVPALQMLDEHNKKKALKRKSKKKS